MCFEIAASEIREGAASSPTEAGPRASRSTMRRRVVSASAWNTASSRSSLLRAGRLTSVPRQRLTKRLNDVKATREKSMPKIHQELTFAAPPARVYRALVDSAQHAKFTGAPAEIGAAAGDAWSAYGGKISGRHVELVEGTSRRADVACRQLARRRPLDREVRAHARGRAAPRSFSTTTRCPTTWRSTSTAAGRRCTGSRSASISRPDADSRARIYIHPRLLNQISGTTVLTTISAMAIG